MILTGSHFCSSGIDAWSPQKRNGPRATIVALLLPAKKLERRRSRLLEGAATLRGSRGKTFTGQTVSSAWQQPTLSLQHLC